MATIKQVSEQAGVSQATVSRVMNGSARVSDSTRQRVEQAMKDLGYTPNAFAQSLASNRSNSVGLVVSELNGPFYGELMEGLELTLREANKYLLIASGHSNETMEKSAVEFLVNRRCDVLVLHAERLSNQYLESLAKRIPIVLINRLVPSLSAFCIYLDNEDGGYQATQHLLDKGCRRVACISGPTWKLDAQERLRGYQRALQEAGIEVDPRLITTGDFRVDSGREAVQRLLGQRADIDGLFVGNDDMAMGAISELQSLNLRVPEDIAVIGFDDAPYARYMTPSLSSMYLPINEMAVMAGQQILQRVYKQAFPLQSRFQATLRPRQSSGA